MKNGKILIIDDNEDVLFALNLLLEPYVEQIKVTTQPERIEHFMSTFVPDVILLDMNFRRDAISGQEGFFWLEKIKAADPDAVVLFITAYADTEKAVRAIKAGATDFIPKPWEKEKLLATLSAALKLRESRTEINTLKQRVEALGSPDDTGFEIIGESDVMQELFATIAKLKDTDANILILGENGTGKDLIARALYHHSPRCNQVFISIDLGSIPEQLFESELFGYEKGAFTDARRDKPGRMEVASGGTLFLDEIGNLSLPMQAKLLTAIEKRQILRLGATRSVPIDVRLISATNEALSAFRTRLYNVVVAEAETEAWQKLIRVLTHEIMNSIAPIISLSETVTERASSNGLNERDYSIMLQAMQTIHRRSKGLLDFVENYRKLTRIPVPMQQLFPVSSLFDDLRGLYPAGAISFSFSVRPVDLRIYADRAMIEQVLINLLKNAVEACQERSYPEVRVNAFRREGVPVITVSDNGYGIVPEAMDKVFVPFFTTKQGGSGIGLSVCRQIMNRHGGSISVISEEEKGTTFTLQFPQTRVL